jgi:hypothetical protein
MGKKDLTKKKLKFYENQINKAIKKYSKKNSPNVDEIKKLKCQIVEPWKRTLGIIIGLGFLGLSLFLMHNHPIEFFISLGCVLIGIFIVVAAVRGNKKTVDEILTQTGDGILNAILDSL